MYRPGDSLREAALHPLHQHARAYFKGSVALARGRGLTVRATPEGWVALKRNIFGRLVPVEILGLWSSEALHASRAASVRAGDHHALSDLPY